MSENSRQGHSGNNDRADGTPACDIAIVGMSCLFAKAEGLSAYWSNILNGVDAVTDVPAERWDAQPYLAIEPGRIGHIHCAKGAFLDNTFSFDPVGLRVPPSAVRGADPDQFLVLRLVHEALTDYGGADRLDAERTEVIIGRTAANGLGSTALAHRTEGVVSASEMLTAVDPNMTKQTLSRVQEEMLADLPPFTGRQYPALFQTLQRDGSPIVSTSPARTIWSMPHAPRDSWLPNWPFGVYGQTRRIL